MRWLKLHNWVVAIGLVAIFFGLANAASVVSAISSSDTDVDELDGSAEAGAWYADLTDESWAELPDFAQDQPVADTPFVEVAGPSASFLALPGSAETKALVDKTTDLLLSELHEAEMLYPQDIADRIATLPAPDAPEIPQRLIIPAIELDAPILPAEAEVLALAGQSFQVWRAPDQFGAGWHVTSATLGVVGNTVLNGHHNVYGEVFKRLVDLNPGDVVVVESENASHSYVIVNRMILPEKYAPLTDRVANAQWILPSEDERLTLITCWPYESNTHRLILVARPDK
jgi:LPXTG-site transpeptidase (sortase) family protein